MYKQYYNPQPKTVLGKAKANRDFYSRFVNEYIPSSLHALFWTGQQLKGLITDLKNEFMLNYEDSKTRELKAEISFYSNLYKYLTNNTNDDIHIYNSTAANGGDGAGSSKPATFGNATGGQSFINHI